MLNVISIADRWFTEMTVWRWVNIFPFITNLSFALTRFTFINDWKVFFRVMDCIVHGVNSIVSMVDLFIATRACSTLHFYQSPSFLFSYMLSSIVYFIAVGFNPHQMAYIHPILSGGLNRFALFMLVIFHYFIDENLIKRWVKAMKDQRRLHHYLLSLNFFINYNINNNNNNSIINF